MNSSLRGLVLSRFALARIVAPILVSVMIIATVAPTSQASPGADPLTPTPDWVGNLLSANTNLMAMSNPASSGEELPGLGHKFELLFAMQDDQDPLNATNDVISVFTTQDYPAGAGVAFRNTPPGFKITALRNQLQLKYYFVNRSCSGGSPRIQVAVDTDGDGTSNGNAFGYLGNVAFGGGCLSNTWIYEDMANIHNPAAKWDLTQFGGTFTNTWAQVETFFAAFPNHRVRSGSLVDDSCSFAALSCGQAYYDLFTFENRTLEQDQDTVGGK